MVPYPRFGLVSEDPRSPLSQVWFGSGGPRRSISKVWFGFRGSMWYIIPSLVW